MVGVGWRMVASGLLVLIGLPLLLCLLGRSCGEMGSRATSADGGSVVGRVCGGGTLSGDERFGS